MTGLREILDPLPHGIEAAGRQLGQRIVGAGGQRSAQHQQQQNQQTQHGSFP